MVPVGFSGQHLPAEAAAQITGVIDHEVTDLIRDHWTPVFCNKDDMVREQVNRVCFFVVIHLCPPCKTMRSL